MMCIDIYGSEKDLFPFWEKKSCQSLAFVSHNLLGFHFLEFFLNKFNKNLREKMTEGLIHLNIFN